MPHTVTRMSAAGATLRVRSMQLPPGSHCSFPPTPRERSVTAASSGMSTYRMVQGNAPDILSSGR